MDAPSEVSGFSGKIFIINSQHIKEMNQMSSGFTARGKFSKYDGTHAQTADRRSLSQAPLPSLEAGLFPENREDHRGVDGGDQGLASGKVAVPRSSSRASRLSPE